MSVNERRFRYLGKDGTALAGFRWGGAPGKARAILQIAHGAGEHAGRYRERLASIANAGVVIYASDHRGHGLTSGMSHLGDFGPGGAEACVSDMAKLSELARRETPGVPLILLGHSMGGMFAQAYALAHSELIDGLVLSGTRGRGPRLEGGFNSSFANPRTEYDWLSRDENEVDRYLADPFCGIQFNEQSLKSVLRLAEDTSATTDLSHIRAGLPVYVLVGGDDPVHARLEAIQPLVEAYRAAGLDVTFKVYAGGRHEMFNETNRNEVLRELLFWLESSCLS